MPFNTLVGEANYWANEINSCGQKVALFSWTVLTLLALTGNSLLSATSASIVNFVQFTIIIIIFHIVFK